MKISLQKMSQRALSRSILDKQLDHARRRATAGNRSAVWSAGSPRITEERSNGHILYTATITLKRTGRQAAGDVLARQVAHMQRIAEDAVRGRGWTGAGAAKPTLPADTNVAECETPADTATEPQLISLDRDGHFSHLYGLDAQIEQVLSAVAEYVRSDFANRFHCVLHGAPACGKTEVLRSLSRMVGADNVLHFDATSTTAAGAKQLLLESANVPPILCIEEIEKADEQSLRWLLGVMDYRAEVRSVKFRSGIVSREVKLLCLATVNDLPLFKRMMDGALASRFSHKIMCPRPSRQVLEMILHREIIRSGGDPAWIAPALDWCLDCEKTNDPRRVITVCLCGRERLLTGEYQNILTATMEQ